MRKVTVILGIFCILAFSQSLFSQTGWIMVPAKAFQCRTHNGQYDHYRNGWDYLIVTGSTGVGDRQYDAPVIFPMDAHGKWVRSLMVKVLDDTNTGNVMVSLQKVDLFSGERDDVFFAQTSVAGTPGEIMLFDNTGTMKYINNSRYAWHIHVYFSEAPSDPWDLRVYNVRIKYN